MLIPDARQLLAERPADSSAHTAVGIAGPGPIRSARLRTARGVGRSVRSVLSDDEGAPGASRLAFPASSRLDSHRRPGRGPSRGLERGAPTRQHAARPRSEGRWFAVWKNPENLTDRQAAKLAMIEQTNGRLYRACLLTEQLRQIYLPSAAAASRLLEVAPTLPTAVVRDDHRGAGRDSGRDRARPVEKLAGLCPPLPR
jgi:hypothetical protein